MCVCAFVLGLCKSIILGTMLYIYVHIAWSPMVAYVNHSQGFLMFVWVILGVTKWAQKRNREVRLISDWIDESGRC